MAGADPGFQVRGRT